MEPLNEILAIIICEVLGLDNILKDKLKGVQFAIDVNWSLSFY